MQANTPCLEQGSYNASPEQKFYFAEIGRDNPEAVCEDVSQHFQEIESDRYLSEWKFQEDNLLLNRMDELLHYTFSVWPSSEYKKEVPLKFY